MEPREGLPDLRLDGGGIVDCGSDAQRGSYARIMEYTTLKKAVRGL